MTQASLILAAWPVSSLLVPLIQPALNRHDNTVYLVLTGTVNSASFCSFYFSVSFPDSYLYLAILSRFICGTTLFLINNKTAVGLTKHLHGNVGKSTTLWEVFNSAGQATGAYIGSCLNDKVGFPLTMTVSGAAVLVVVVMVCICYPQRSDDIEENTNVSTTDTYLLYVSRDMLVYCWCPMVCIGGCMVYSEGILTEFYLKDFSKSLEFGGVLLGVSGVVYTVSALIIGLLRERWSCVTIVGLVSGLVGCGVILPFIGPFISFSTNWDIIISVFSFNLLLVCSCAIQLNSLTISARALSECARAATTTSTDNQLAMSVSLNGVNVAYNIGGFVGPIVGGSLLKTFRFGEVFAMGAPFFVAASLIVGAFYLRKNASSFC